MIYPRLVLHRTPCPSTLCGECRNNKNRVCKCHDIDLINSTHSEIHIEEQEIIVKTVVDLDHFRHEGLMEWFRRLKDNILFKLHIDRFD